MSLGRLSENGWEWGAIEEQMWIKFSMPEEAERKEHANRKIWIKLAIERTFCSSLKDSLSQLTQLLKNYEASILSQVVSVTKS